MAKIIEQTFVVKLSTMVRDEVASSEVTDAEFNLTLETIVQELAGGNVMVEITTSDTVVISK
jgi:hypothetical protein